MILGLLNKLSQCLITSFDIFGLNPTLRIMRRDKFNSGCGFLGTLIILCLIAIYLASEIIEMVSRTSPQVVSSEEQVFDTSAFPLLNDNFTLAVTLVTLNSDPIYGYGQYYNITITHCDRIRSTSQDGSVIVTQNCNLLPTEPCNMSHFTTELQQSLFSSIRFGVVRCVNREYMKTNPLIIQGLLTGQHYQYLKIQLEPCQNSTNYTSCASLEQQKEKLQAGKYAVYTSDYLMQMNNPDQPFQQIIRSQATTFSSSTSKTALQQFKVFETITDTGILLEENSQKLNLQQSVWSETTDIFNSQYFISHYINIDYKKVTNERSYIKLQTILSKIGGIWNVFVFFTSIILRPFLIKLMYLSISGEIYEFNQNPQSNYLHNETIQKSQIKNQKQSFILMIKQIFSCNKNKSKQQFMIAQQDILDQIDIVYILTKFQELDIIKNVLFNETQQKLMNQLQKPILNLDEFKERFQKRQSQLIEDSGGSNQTSIIRKDFLAKSQIDKRLIQLYDKRFSYRNGSQINELSQSGNARLSEIDFIVDHFCIQEPPPQFPK